MAQQDAAESRPAPCFFATFHTAHAAAYAARLNLNPTHQRMMRCAGESAALWLQCPAVLCLLASHRLPPSPSAIPP